MRWTLLAIVSVLLLTLVGAGIWSWLGRREDAAHRDLGAVLVTAQGAIGSGEAAELEAAATALRQFIASHSGTRAGHQASYVLGQVEFQRRLWDAAVTAFGEASRRDRGSIGGLSRLGQGYALEAKGDAAEALKVYQQALNGLGAKDFLYGDLLLAKARAQELTKDSAGAVATYRQYLKDLPTADGVEDIRIRLALLGVTG
jgi:tetratricopeptide (TPR) repeat protein